jgi:hypothetical protein
VSKVYSPQNVMTIFSSPAYATMLSYGDVLLLGRKAEAFVVYLPVPFRLIAFSLLTLALLLTHLMLFSRVSAGCLSSLWREGGQAKVQDG